MEKKTICPRSLLLVVEPAVETVSKSNRGHQLRMNKWLNLEAEPGHRGCMLFDSSGKPHPHLRRSKITWSAG